MPMSRLSTGRSVMSRPATWTRPESGSSKPAIMRSDVVLPQPDGPSREKNSPAAMSSVTPSTATTRPSKVFVTSSSLMVAEVIPPHPEEAAKRPGRILMRHTRRVATRTTSDPILRDATLRVAPQRLCRGSSGLPWFFVPQDGVEDGEQLVGDGDCCGHLGFASSNEPFVKHLEDGVMPLG